MVCLVDCSAARTRHYRACGRQMTYVAWRCGMMPERPITPIRHPPLGVVSLDGVHFSSGPYAEPEHWRVDKAGHIQAQHIVAGPVARHHLLDCPFHVCLLLPFSSRVVRHEPGFSNEKPILYVSPRILLVPYLMPNLLPMRLAIILSVHGSRRKPLSLGLLRRSSSSALLCSSDRRHGMPGLLRSCLRSRSSSSRNSQPYTVLFAIPVALDMGSSDMPAFRCLTACSTDSPCR